MKNRFFLFFLLLFLNPLYGQKLMYSMDDKSPEVIQYQIKNNIGEAVIIYGNDIYPDKYNEVNEQKLKAAIQKAFPDKWANGYGILDWEGKAFNTLLYDSSKSKEFQYTLNQFLKALSIAKQVRPNVKWGYFSFPFRGLLYKSTEDWINNNNKMSALFNQVDVLYPVFYPRSIQFDMDYRLLNGMKTFKSKYRKYVIAVMWHRVEGPIGRYSTLGKSTFIKNVNLVMNSSGIDKVTWWAKDTYYYKHQYKSFLSEAKDFNTFNKNYSDLIINFSDSIIKNGK